MSLNSPNKTGLLLVNLGTPASPSVKDVRKYLKEFLSDPLVIDINPVVRWCLVNFIIAPFRSPKSAKLYQKIWTSRGSPLLFHGLDLQKELVKSFGDSWNVELAMRYGHPSIENGLKKMLDLEEIVVFPLFPQFSKAAYASAVEKVKSDLINLGYSGKVSVIKPYFNHPEFIKSFCSLVSEKAKEAEKIFFTFHGIPIRHCIESASEGSPCSKDPRCCESLRQDNQQCYRAQCFETARLMAKELDIKNYEVVFQSRFGRDPWITPYADYRLDEITEAGVQSVTYISPSFTADCLETIEEVGEGFQHAFIEKGGKSFELVSSLNASQRWVEAIQKIIDQRDV